MRPFPLLAVLAVLLLPGSALAAWSAQHELDPMLPPGCHLHARSIPAACFGEPAPRAAINARGQAVVAWVTDSDRVKVAFAGGSGRFGRATTLGSGFRPAVTIAADGSALIAWEGKGGLRYARRAAGHGAGGSRLLLPGKAKQGNEDIRLAPQPDGTTIVVYGGQSDHLHALSLSKGGTVSTPVDLGAGFLEKDAEAPGGQIAVCCVAAMTDPSKPAYQQPPATRTMLHAPGGTWTAVDPPLTAHQDVEGLAVSAAATLFGTVDVVNRGDAGTLGTPGLLRAGAGGAFLAPAPAPVKVPHLSFGPVPALDGAGRSVLAYQEKDASSSFSRSAPVYGVSAAPGAAFGSRATLDKGKAREPLAAPLGSGAVVAWETASHRWGVARERGGSFRHVAGPAGGPGTLGEDANSNRSLATAGSYAILAWESYADGSIRVSVAKL